MDTAEKAALLAAIAAVSSFLVTVVLAAINYRYMRLTAQIAREATATRRASVYLQADKMITDIRASRHRLYDVPEKLTEWTAEDRALANEVSVVCQRVAYLWSLGLLEKEAFAENWGKTLIDTWDIIEPWVQEYRVQTKAPNQREHLERLVMELRKDDALMAHLYPPGIDRVRGRTTE